MLILSALEGASGVPPLPTPPGTPQDASAAPISAVRRIKAMRRICRLLFEALVELVGDQCCEGCTVNNIYTYHRPVCCCQRLTSASSVSGAGASARLGRSCRTPISLAAGNILPGSLASSGTAPLAGRKP